MYTHLERDEIILIYILNGNKMKHLNFFKSTVFMILLFFGWNTIACFLAKWYPDWVSINIFFAAAVNVFIGIMVTYNGLVAVNKRAIEKMLTPRP